MRIVASTLVIGRFVTVVSDEQKTLSFIQIKPQPQDLPALKWPEQH